jgi:hypothetical protein
MHELHIFIFVLAIVYVLFSVMTTLLGIAKVSCGFTGKVDSCEK